MSRFKALPENDELLDLLAEKSASGLRDRDESQMLGLLDVYPEVDATTFDEAAAFASIALLQKQGLEPLPDHVRSNMRQTIRAAEISLGRRDRAGAGADGVAGNGSGAAADRHRGNGSAYAGRTRSAPVGSVPLNDRVPTSIESGFAADGSREPGDGALTDASIPQQDGVASDPLPMRSPADPRVEEQELLRRGSVPMLAWAGWLAAAACLLVAFVVTRPADAPSIAEQRSRFVASAAGVANAAFMSLEQAGLATAAHPLLTSAASAGADGVLGLVEWSDATDTGYMTISGLAANDPSEFQYQLWIFDADRPTGELPEFETEGLPILTQRPVDGGVFDIRPGPDGRAIVPIDAKLPIGKAALFAITVEPPGGVVVSDRDIVLVAVPGAEEG